MVGLQGNVMQCGAVRDANMQGKANTLNPKTGWGGACIIGNLVNTGKLNTNDNQVSTRLIQSEAIVSA